jgi:hypothetical protein
VATLAELDRPEIAGVRWSLPVQWMVKLRPLGYVEGRVVPPLIDVLEAELDGAPTAECTLGPETWRIGGDWLGAPVAGLDELAAVVFEVTSELVPVTHPQPFRAEVVLARGRVPRELAGLPVSARWTARSVALVADRSSPRAPRFENLTEIELGR